MMRVDKYGQIVYSSDDVCNLYLKDPDRILRTVLTEEDISFDPALTLDNIPTFVKYVDFKINPTDFDSRCQDNWFIPEEYKSFDIAKWVLDQCQTQEELQRAGEELLLFQERDMFILLKYMKYLVDTMREHDIVWGVGRGSSVASFVLFLIGVHKINSLHYQLSIDEFLK